MKTKMVYLADDGTEWETESECLKHEEKTNYFQPVLSHTQFYDEDGQRIYMKPTNDSIELQNELDSIMDEAYYLYIDTDLPDYIIALASDAMRKQFGIYFPDQNGWYGWNAYANNCWASYMDIFTRLEEQINDWPQEMKDNFIQVGLMSTWPQELKDNFIKLFQN